MNINIRIFDLTGVSERIQNRPDIYGLTNLTDPCLDTTKTEVTVCETPDEYYFWDDIHPTRVVQKILGEAMAEQLGK